MFLYLSQRIPARSAVKFSASSVLIEGSYRDNFCSHSSPKVQLGTEAVQGVRRPGKRLMVVNLSEELKDCCCREVQSQRLQHLAMLKGCHKECEQGIFLKDLKVIVKLRKDRVFEICRRIA